MLATSYFNNIFHYFISISKIITKRYSDYKLTPLHGFGHQLFLSAALIIIYYLFSQKFNNIISKLKLDCNVEEVTFICTYF